MLLTQFKRFAQVVKQMGGKGGLLRGGEMPRNMNPMQMAKLNQQMSKVINPQMLKQMGGVGGLQNLMRQVGGQGRGGLFG